MFKHTENYNESLTDEVTATPVVDTAQGEYVLIEVKGMLDRKEAEAMNFLYWRL